MAKSKIADLQFIASFNSHFFIPFLFQYIMITIDQLNTQTWKIMSPFFKKIQFFIAFAVRKISGNNQLLSFKKKYLGK